MIDIYCAGTLKLICPEATDRKFYMTELYLNSHLPCNTFKSLLIQSRIKDIIVSQKAPIENISPGLRKLNVCLPNYNNQKKKKTQTTKITDDYLYLNRFLDLLQGCFNQISVMIYCSIFFVHTNFKHRFNIEYKPSISYHSLVESVHLLQLCSLNKRCHFFSCDLKK